MKPARETSTATPTVKGTAVPTVTAIPTPTMTATSTPGAVAVPGCAGVPADTNADGLYDDVNDNSRRDFDDVVLYFNRMTWTSANEPVTAFDCNGNGRIDFADVVWLFNRL